MKGSSEIPWQYDGFFIKGLNNDSNRSVAWHQRGRASVEEMRGDSLLHESPCAALLFST